MKINRIIKRGALITVLLVLTACSQKASGYTLTLGGDVMLARNDEAIFRNDNGPIDPWGELKQDGVLPRENDDAGDLFFANLESPLGSNSSNLGAMNLCSDPEEIRVLVEGRLDLVTLANNHRDDCQLDGDLQTGSLLAEENIQAVGMGDEAVMVDTGQGKLAVIAVEDVTRPVDIGVLAQRIQNARKSVQFVIVSIHWGNEYQAGPDERQQHLAQQIADAGADVIWGHHPHVLQKMEWLQSTDGRQVLVFYSLGNLLSDQWMLEDAQRSALVRLTVSTGKISQIEVIPIKMDRASKKVKALSDTEEEVRVRQRLNLDEALKQNQSVVIN